MAVAILQTLAHGSDSLSSTDITALIDSCISSAQSIRSITCRFHHVMTVTDMPSVNYEGSIAYRSPREIVIHYYTPTEEYYCTNDSVSLFYSVSSNAGFRFRQSNLQQVEKQILQLLGQIQMNTLQTMRHGYDFSFVAAVGDSDVVVSACPKNGWKELSKIWLKISRKKHYLVGSELYDKKGSLISQSIYYNPVSIPLTNIWFPTKILMKTVDKNQLRVDKIEYTRMKFNGNLSSQELTVPLPKDAEILEPTKQGK